MVANDDDATSKEKNQNEKCNSINRDILFLFPPISTIDGYRSMSLPVASIIIHLFQPCVISVASLSRPAGLNAAAVMTVLDYYHRTEKLQLQLAPML